MRGASDPANVPRAIPTGWCWCDCGQQAEIGAFFAHGHNRTAEALLRATQDTRDLPTRLAEAGFIPGQRSLTDAVLAAHPDWQRCGTAGCRVVNDVQTLARHRAKAHNAPV